MSKMLSNDDFIALVEQDADIILPIANGEPIRLLNILEENYTRLQNVKIHQLLALRERAYIEGKMPGHLSHTSYFLSGATRKAFANGTVELVPNVFHEVPRILRKTTNLSMVLAVASPMDEHGYFTLGTQADYVAEFIGKVPFVLEVNEHMPRTFGENQIHISQIAGYVVNHVPLSEIQAPPIGEKDMKIAQYVANEIRDGDTLQIGIGGIPNAVMSMLKNHKHLGIHTEMLPDSVVDLIEAGAVDGTRKFTNQGKVVASFIYGSKRLYDFVHNNPSIEMLPVSIVNDPRELAKEPNLVSINATTEVDLYGQCASETVAGQYYSSTGGQADFARGVRFSEFGKGFICMHSTAKNDTISRIKLQLTPGSVVTTSKNDVDYIVTEYGIAHLYGKSLSKRAEALIDIAHPKFREELSFEAKKIGLFV
ncbi:propionyl-CoA--succinate CoA transferase [Sporosarcina ureilytica]|uniref:Propionyl-CoA--succinate CoA transferase n=2 Tax=Sporosarcina ureilytica TaxID=298596 RepID=A0A1D8JC06_9BACL|nr:acetyl-CoA hydrolase/transferase C-terminal domain-containing protein [Sporosarcina ureilytica]AOV06231.1 propionyl-CoA--succinate CoA transferase [Sporosarcina ureilytica]